MAYSVLHTRHRIWLPVLAAALLVVGTFGTAFAQEDPTSDVYISFEADKDGSTVEGAVKLGDYVTLTLEVTYPDDHNVIVHKLPRDWGAAFEVRDQSQAQTVLNDDGTKTTSQVIKAAVFGTGNLETPDLPISVRGPGRDRRAGVPSSSGVEGTLGTYRSRRSFGGHPTPGRSIYPPMG